MGDGHLDATNAYWTAEGSTGSTSGTIGKAALAGGPAMTIALGQNFPLSIAVDATSVYWADGVNSTIVKVPVGGGVLQTLASASSPQGIAIDSTSVYWLDALPGGAVMSVPIAGGSASTLASEPGVTPLSIAVDATSVYWTNAPSGSASGSVMKVPIGGGTPITIAAGQTPASSNNGGLLAVDAMNVYWVGQYNAGSSVMEVAK